MTETEEELTKQLLDLMRMYEKSNIRLTDLLEMSYKTQETQSHMIATVAAMLEIVKVRDDNRAEWMKEMDEQINSLKK